jgi:deazaflavin-dependent oxidoreductase (nitroreductase family)
MTAPKSINAVVRPVLRSRFHWLLSRKLMLVTVRGRRTGRLHTFPVGYVQEGDVLHVLVGDYETKRWWRNLEAPAPVELTLRGRTVRATGVLLRWDSDSQALTAVLGRYVTAFRGARHALQIPWQDGGPDPERLRAAARAVVMVRAQLEPITSHVTETAAHGGEGPTR